MLLITHSQLSTHSVILNNNLHVVPRFMCSSLPYITYRFIPCNSTCLTRSTGPFATVSRLTPIHQVSLPVLSHAACASMSTTTMTTTTRDRGDRYGPMEWAQLMTLCSGLPRWAGTKKAKPIWILLKQDIVSGSGISWTSLSHISTPPLSFHRVDALTITVFAANVN